MIKAFIFSACILGSICSLGQVKTMSVRPDCADCGPSNPPPAPPNPKATSNTCGNKTLSYVGSAGSGIEWLWQQPGDPAYYDGPTFTATKDGTYYLIAQRVSSGEFSTSAGFVTVKLNTTPPPRITNSSSDLLTSVCGGRPLDFIPSSSVSGTSYTWTSSASNVTNVSATGSGRISDIPINKSGSNGTVVYHITPFANGCTGPAVDYSVIVRSSIEIYNLNPTTICTGTTINKTLTSNFSDATYSWTVSAPGISGASDGSGTVIHQTLANNTQASSAATYTVTGTANGCSGTSSGYTVAVLPVPMATAANQNIFSGQTTSIAISSPNGVATTTFSWSAASSDLSGYGIGTGSPIAQVLKTNNTADGLVVYTITPQVTGCYGTPIKVNVNVFKTPVISADPRYLIKQQPVTLSIPADYESYTWKNSSGTVLGTSATIVATVADVYSLTVTKLGATTTVSYSLSDQITDMNMNYIITNTAVSKVDDINQDLGQLPIARANQSIVYFDGFGRPIQTVTTQGSPLKNDVVQPVVYDSYGRVNINYLPYVSDEKTGAYKIDPTGKDSYDNSIHQKFYSNNNLDFIAKDASPFSLTRFEESPLNRPIFQGAPGVDWQPGTTGTYNAPATNDHSLKHDYTTNGSGEVILFNYVNGAIVGGLNFYASNQLTSSKSKDEQNNAIIEFRDKNNRVVCKKVQSGVDANSNTVYASTYYIYDDLGNLVVVLPPEAINSTLSALTGQ